MSIYMLMQVRVGQLHRRLIARFESLDELDVGVANTTNYNLAGGLGEQPKDVRAVLRIRTSISSRSTYRFLGW